MSVPPSQDDPSPAQEGSVPRVGRASRIGGDGAPVDDPASTGDPTAAPTGAAADGGYRDRDDGPRPEPGFSHLDPAAPPGRMTLRGAPVTVGLILVMSVIELALQANSAWREWVIDTFALSPLLFYAVLKGVLPLVELKAMATHAFLHGGLVHLLFNMLAFAVLGPPIERGLGSLVFSGAYLLLCIAGGLGHVGWEWLVFSFDTSAEPVSLMIPMVGASGAIFGLLGLDLGRRARAIEAIPEPFRAVSPGRYLLGASSSVLIVNIMLMLSGVPISGAAHLGGFFCGLALSRVLIRRGGGRVI